MAVTQNTYTGNNSTTNFAFTFPYLKKADVKVKLDGTTRPTSEYTWFNATTIQMNTAPASGVVVLIYRDTSNDSKAGTFYAGSMIKAEDLNSNFDQILYVAQEVSNNAMSTLGTAEMQGNLAFGKSMGIVFEGDTNDAYETTLKVVDPTADRQLNLPNASGTIVSTGDTGTVTGTMLADATIGTADLANNAVTTAKIAAEAVTADEIANATITGTELAADCVNGTKIADDSINSEHYVNGSIDTAHIADSQVTTAKLADVNVTTAKIANDAVTNAKIADDQIDSEHYVDGSIDTAHIADLQVTTAKIAADAVTNAKIADDSIDSEHYVDGSIDTAHIADDQVTVGKLNIPRVETLAGMTSTTASTLAAATDLSASITNLNITQGMTKATSLTTTSDTEFPTSKAVNDRILTVTNALGGFVAIADKDNFPTAHPDPSGNAGTVVSISDAAGISVNSSGVGSLATRAGGSDAVIINGFPSALRGGATVGSATNANPYVLPSSVGLQVQTTTTAHTYDYHKYFINEEDANKLSGDIQDFQERYRVAASAPTASKDDGDLWFDTTNNKMMVYDATASAWADVATPGNFSINTISSYSGTGGNSATFNGTAYRFVLSNPGSNAQQHIVSINGVIQKPNTGTSQPGEGFAIDGSSIIFSNAPASGSDYFIITIGNSVDIGTPSDNVITTAMLQNSAVTTAKITNDAVDGTKIADDAIDSEHYTDGSIDTAHIAADQITGALIADDAVGAEHIEVLDANLQLADSVKIQVGTGNDLTLEHNGSNSKINNTTGTLYVQGDIISFAGEGGSENLATFTKNGAVELYYDNSKKFATQSGGVRVFGDLENHDDDFVAKDNCKFLAGNSGDLEIYHDGGNSWVKESGTGALYIDTDGAAVKITKGGADENMAVFNTDGAVELYYDNVKKFETTSYGALVSSRLNVQTINIEDWNSTHETGALKCGTGNDLKIYHDGTSSYIRNYTSRLDITSPTGIALWNSGGTEPYLKCTENGGVDLYYDNSEKFKTTSTGATVTGTVEQTGYCLDEWRLHTNLRGDTSPVTNWERCDSSGMANKLIDDSNGMTESSGIFTFPSTGKWKITTFMQWQTPSGQTEAWAGMHGQFSQDGTNYTAMDWHYASMAAGSSYQKSTSGFTVDVTNSSDAKLKFYTVMQQSNNSTGTYLLGHTSYNATWIRFERIGDT